MDAYISKPIRTEELFQNIENLTWKPAVVLSHDTSSTEAEFDAAVYIARTDNDGELACELIEIFFEDSPKTVAEIRNAINQGGAERLERAAHSLKGALGYFSGGRSVNAALALQTMGANRDLSKAEEGLAELEQALNLLRPSLAAFVGEYAL